MRKRKEQRNQRERRDKERNGCGIRIRNKTGRKSQREEDIGNGDWRGTFWSENKRVRKREREWILGVFDCLV